MANRKKCPLCKKTNDHVKKGKNAAGDTRLQCKGCNKSYIDTPAGRKLAIANLKANAKTTAKKTTVKKTTVKKTAVKKTAVVGKVKQTVISVNGNKLSPKTGEPSVDDAFEMAKDSFLELKKQNHTVTVNGDTKNINFSIKLGRKG